MDSNLLNNNRIRDRFKPVQRPLAWMDIPKETWNRWTWQQQKRLRTEDQLAQVLTVFDDERAALDASKELFDLAITPYYASLIEPNNPLCPIRLQCIPKPGELDPAAYELSDPLAEDSHMPVPGITHRYPDRVLFYTTHHCAVYCRHCTRKRKVSDPSTAATQQQLEQGLNYIAAHPEVRDILISGGDPLSNSDDRLEYILERLRAIEHVEILRLCTRNLVTLPQRITLNLAQILKKYHPIYVHTHFNHPKECTREAFDACALLADAGCVLNNQMVLLRGVNDDPAVVLELNQKLLMMRVKPYYIFQCDMAQGLSHLRTPIAKGIEIIDSLRGWTSGIAVPHFVVDLPGGGGKVSLLPEYVMKREGKKWLFRNYQNIPFEYFDAD